MNLSKNVLGFSKELHCRYRGNQLLIMTTTMNFITILQSIILIAFLHGYFLQCSVDVYIVFV